MFWIRHAGADGPCTSIKLGRQKAGICMALSIARRGSIQSGKKVRVFQNVWFTYPHGGGLATYRSEAVYIYTYIVANRFSQQIKKVQSGLLNPQRPCQELKKSQTRAETALFTSSNFLYLLTAPSNPIQALFNPMMNNLVHKRRSPPSSRSLMCYIQYGRKRLRSSKG